MSLKTILRGEQLAGVLGRNYRKNLLFIIYRLTVGSRARIFSIPKKSGGRRQICAPTAPVIKLQRQLLKLMEGDFSPKIYAHGFVKKRSISTNADQHVGKRWVLNIDLSDFFGSITFPRIYGRLQAKPYSYSRDVAKLIAHISCYNKALMQGGALSPIISNMVCDKLDAEMARFCRSLNCTYTRYADDISISSNRTKFPGEIAYLPSVEDRTEVQLSNALRKIIEENGFAINEKKTRLQGAAVRQEVTGLVVNEKRNVPRSFIRQVRCMLHAWEKFGLTDSTNEHFKKWRRNRGRLAKYEASNFEWVLRGKIEFIRHIRGSSDGVFQKLAKRFNDLCSIKRFKIVPAESRDVLREAVWVIEGVFRREVKREFAKPNNVFSRVLRYIGFPVRRFEEKIEIMEEPFIGTVFFAEGVGVVTCAHCYAEGAVIYNPLKRQLQYLVKQRFVDLDNDTCVLETIDEIPVGLLPRARLKLAEDAAVLGLGLGDELQFAGFPSNLPENHISIKTARVSRFLDSSIDGRMLKARERQIVVDNDIIEGTSGGPVLHAGKVVGIAARGPGQEQQLAASVVVPITALPQLR